MRDFLGQQLNIGDEVVYVQIGYRTLKRGKIARFTQEMVVINGDREQLKQFPSQIVRIDNE